VGKGKKKKVGGEGKATPRERESPPGTNRKVVSDDRNDKRGKNLRKTLLKIRKRKRDK